MDGIGLPIDTVSPGKAVNQTRPPSSGASVWTLSGLSAQGILSRTVFCGLVLTVLVISAICLTNAIAWVDKPFAGFLFNERMVLGGVGQYHWTGTQAGLQTLDKILKANNEVVSSAKDLEATIQTTRLGDPIKYSIGRGGQVIEVTIPTMRFSWTDLLMTFGI